MAELLKLLGITKKGIWDLTSKIAKFVAVMAIVQSLVDVVVFLSVSSIAGSEIPVNRFKELYTYHIYALIASTLIILLLNVFKDYYIYKLDEYREIKIASKFAIFLLIVDISAFSFSLLAYLNFINAINETYGVTVQEFLANLSVNLSTLNLVIDSVMFLLSIVNILAILSVLYYVSRGLDAKSLRVILITLFLLFILSPPGVLGSISRLIFYILVAYGFKEIGDRVRNVYRLENNPENLYEKITSKLEEGNVYLKTIAIEEQLPLGVIYYLVEKWIKDGKIKGMVDGFVLLPS